MPDFAIPVRTPVVVWLPCGPMPGRVRSWVAEPGCGHIYTIDLSRGDVVRCSTILAFDASALCDRPFAVFAPHWSRA